MCHFYSVRLKRQDKPVFVPSFLLLLIVNCPSFLFNADGYGLHPFLASMRHIEIEEMDLVNRDLPVAGDSLDQFHG
jgi:hypothetical protein